RKTARSNAGIRVSRIYGRSDKGFHARTHERPRLGTTASGRGQTGGDNNRHIHKVRHAAGALARHLKVNVPGEGEEVVVTLSVADAESLAAGGMLTFDDERVNVTPEGEVPFHAALNCAVSLTPFSDLSVTADDLVAEAMSASDCGEAEMEYTIWVGGA